MANEQLEVIVIGGWQTGFHAQSGNVVMVFNFADRPPLAFAMTPQTAREIGESLVTRVEGLPKMVN